MKIRNASQYDTRILGTIFRLVWRELWAQKLGFHDKLPTAPLIDIQTGRKYWRWKYNGKEAYAIFVSLPQLTGDEFIALMRQQHGGPKTSTAVGLRSEDVALCAQQAFYASNGWQRRRGGKNTLNVHVRLALKAMPEFVPLRVRKLREEPTRDVVSERAARVSALLEKWQRKLKLAQTKIKKLRARQKHYQRKLSQRSAA